MRRFLSECPVATRATLAGVSLVVLMLAAAGDAAAQDRDSVEVRVPRARKGRAFNIQIDKNGIRVEGTSDSVETGARIIFDARGRRTKSSDYNEMGSDIVKFGNDVFVGPDDLVRGDVVVFGGDVRIEGTVRGDVVVMMGDTEVGSGAEIEGDLVVIGGDLDEDPGAVVRGERVRIASLSIPLKAFGGSYYGHGGFFDFVLVPIKFFVCAILAFLIVLFLRTRVVRGQEHISAGVLKSFGAGFLVLCVGSAAVFLLFVILLITLIGIPLALMLVVSCIAVSIIAHTVFAYALGLKVNELINLHTSSSFAVVLVGLAAMFLPELLGHGIAMLPFGTPVGWTIRVLGGLFCVFGYVVGIGALFLSRFGSRGVPSSASVTVD